MTTPESPTDLTARYGAPSRGRRIARAAVVAVVAVAFLAWLAWTAFFHATPQVSSELLGWEVVDEHEVVARVEVALDDGTEEASCRATAFSEDHTVVGELAWPPVDGTQEVAVRTERRATSVELVGCTADGQPRPR